VQFSFIIKDDQCGAEEAGQNYDSLYDAGMQISLGGVTSGAGEAFATKANADGLFSMTPSGSADPVIMNKPYSFRLCFGDPDQGVLAAQNIKAANYQKVGALYDTSDTYSTGIYEAFKAEMAKLGVEYVEQTFDAENKTDFTTQAGQLADCDVVFMPFYYNEAQLFIKAAVAKNSDAVFFGCDGFDGIASYIEGVENKVMYITPFDVNATDAETKAFVDAYVAEYGTKPDQFAADAYDVMMVIAAAMNKAGVTDYAISGAELGDILVNTITADDFSYDGLTGNMTWDESGACTKEPNIVEFN
jgi:branched-chain amino acid transport system substrate-binding protein